MRTRYDKIEVSLIYINIFAFPYLLPVAYYCVGIYNRAISWYSFCVGQDIYRFFSIIEIILSNYQQVWTGQRQVL